MEIEAIIQILYKLLGYYITNAHPDSMMDECKAVELAINAIEHEYKGDES